MTAIAAESTGEMPTMIAVRDGPMTPTARVNRIWLIPGAKSPVTKNGQVSFQATSAKSPVRSASVAQMTQAMTVVTSDAASASMPRASARSNRDGERTEEQRRARGEEDDQGRGGRIRTGDFCVPNAAL